MSEMLVWLRATIEGALAAARAADEVAPGPWVNTGQAGLGDAWQIHGARTGAVVAIEGNGTESREVRQRLWIVTMNHSEGGGGVWEREVADHIVVQQPRDTIARCEAELAELNALDVMPHYMWDDRPEYGCPMADPDRWVEPECLCGRDAAVAQIARIKAVGYRHRDGFKSEWLSDSS